MRKSVTHVCQCSSRLRKHEQRWMYECKLGGLVGANAGLLATSTHAFPHDRPSHTRQDWLGCGAGALEHRRVQATERGARASHAPAPCTTKQEPTATIMAALRGEGAAPPASCDTLHYLIPTPRTSRHARPSGSRRQPSWPRCAARVRRRRLAGDTAGTHKHTADITPCLRQPTMPGQTFRHVSACVRSLTAKCR
jgi:hypothetical protein